jgi:hypothetical protein
VKQTHGVGQRPRPKRCRELPSDGTCSYPRHDVASRKRQPEDRQQATGSRHSAFTLDTYTEDVPELHHDAADMVTNLFFDDPVDET